MNLIWAAMSGNLQVDQHGRHSGGGPEGTVSRIATCLHWLKWSTHSLTQR